MDWISFFTFLMSRDKIFFCLGVRCGRLASFRNFFRMSCKRCCTGFKVILPMLGSPAFLKESLVEKMRCRAPCGGVYKTLSDAVKFGPAAARGRPKSQFRFPCHISCTTAGSA